MAKSRIVEKHPEVRDHILLLAEYGHSIRQIAWMVSQVNGQKISGTLVWRTLQKYRNESEELFQHNRNRECPNCHSHLVLELNNPDDPDRFVCGVCGFVLERRVRFVVPKETQVAQYMPANSLNFEKLGQGHPDAFLINVINVANPQFGRRNGDYREFMRKLWELKKHLGVDERLRKLKDKASKRLAELGFNKRKDYIISDEVGRLLDNFYEQHVKPLPNCFQVKQYDPIVDSAIAIALESYCPEDKCTLLQADFRIKSLMKQFLARKIVCET